SRPAPARGRSATLASGRRRNRGRDFVVDEVLEVGTVAADGAVGIALQPQRPELIGQRIDHQQPSDQGIANAEQQFDGLVRLKETDDAGQDAERAGFVTARGELGRRWLGEYAAIAGSVEGLEDADLAIEAEDAAVHDGLLQEHAGIVDQVAGREVVATVDDQIVVLEDVDDVVPRQAGLIWHDLDIGVQVLQRLLGRVDLRLPDALAVVQDLPLQVALVNNVRIDDADRAHASRRQIVRRRRPEPAGADDQDLRVEELELA